MTNKKIMVEEFTVNGAKYIIEKEHISNGISKPKVHHSVKVIDENGWHWYDWTGKAPRKATKEDVINDLELAEKKASKLPNGDVLVEWLDSHTADEIERKFN